MFADDKGERAVRAAPSDRLHFAHDPPTERRSFDEYPLRPRTPCVGLSGPRDSQHALWRLHLLLPHGTTAAVRIGRRHHVDSRRRGHRDQLLCPEHRACEHHHLPDGRQCHTHCRIGDDGDYDSPCEGEVYGCRYVVRENDSGTLRSMRSLRMGSLTRLDDLQAERRSSPSSTSICSSPSFP